MRIGIGLPAAAPGAPGAHRRAVGEWAASPEASGFESTGVADRLVDDDLDPLVALAAAGRAERVELRTPVLDVPWRRSAVVPAEQLASLDQVGGGRLAAGPGHADVRQTALLVGALDRRLVRS